MLVAPREDWELCEFELALECGLAAKEIDVAVEFHGDAVLIGLACEPRQEGADQSELGKELGRVYAREHDVCGFRDEAVIGLVEPQALRRSQAGDTAVELGEKQARFPYPCLDILDMFAVPVVVRQVHDEAACRHFLRCVWKYVHLHLDVAVGKANVHLRINCEYGRYVEVWRTLNTHGT